MFIFDQSNAECHIYTFKDGFLATLAHDLKLKASRFEIKIREEAKDACLWQSTDATFDATGIRVVCAIKNGVECPPSLIGK